jgi:hypothetical protein
MTTSKACRMCGQSEQWHRDNSPRHQFTPRDSASSPTLTNDQPQVQMEHVNLPFDPVLRLALVNAGVITAAQLSQAEKDFHMINGGGSHGGTRSSDTGLSQGQ